MGSGRAKNEKDCGVTSLGRLLPIGYFNFYYFSFFLISNQMGAWSRCVATRLYILYVAADESTSGWEFYC